MEIMTRALHLRKVSLFAEVDRETLTRLAGVCEQHIAMPGDLLFEQGDPGNELWILLDGQVSILIDGREVNTLQPGATFGEIAVLDGRQRTATARVRSDAVLLSLSRSALRALLEQDGGLRCAVLRSLAELRETIEERIERRMR